MSELSTLEFIQAAQPDASIDKLVIGAQKLGIQGMKL